MIALLSSFESVGEAAATATADPAGSTCGRDEALCHVIGA